MTLTDFVERVGRTLFEVPFGGGSPRAANNAELAEIRHAFESVTRDRIIGGDATLSLVTGEDIIEADHLADGIHPGDEGHKRIAAHVGKALNAAVKSAGEGAGAEGTPAEVIGIRSPSMFRVERSDDAEDDAGDGPRSDQTAASSLY